MTFKTHCEIAKGRIDPAPMVNIVFLLLIFLVLSSSYVLQPGLGTMELPISPTATAATFQALVVSVNRDNQLFFNYQPTTLAKLKVSLQAAVRQARNVELVIKADGQVTHGTIAKIEGIAFESGITAVNVAVRPGVGPVAGPPGK